MKTCVHRRVTIIFSKRYGLSRNPLFKEPDWSFLGLFFYRKKKKKHNKNQEKNRTDIYWEHNKNPLAVYSLAGKL